MRYISRAARWAAKRGAARVQGRRVGGPAAAFGLALAALVSGPGARAENTQTGHSWREAGIASFYSRYWQGRRTASGETFDNRALTAAHPWLPFGTRVRVIAEETGQEVVVTITDRMGSARRIIDLSQQAARLLGIMRSGTAFVTLAPE